MRRRRRRSARGSTSLTPSPCRRAGVVRAWLRKRAGSLECSAARGALTDIGVCSKIASHHAALMSEPGRILDLAERKWLQDKWYKLDTSGDGYLDLAETTSLLRDLKKKMTDPEVKAAFEEMDVDGCGNVDFDEFYLWFARQDADQFAHLMLRGAHRQFVKGIVGIGLGMFLPLAAITLLAGPSPLVSFPSRLALPQMRTFASHDGLICTCFVVGTCLRTSPRTSLQSSASWWSP